MGTEIRQIDTYLREGKAVSAHPKKVITGTNNKIKNVVKRPPVGQLAESDVVQNWIRAEVHEGLATIKKNLKLGVKDSLPRVFDGFENVKWYDNLPGGVSMYQRSQKQKSWEKGIETYDWYKIQDGAAVDVRQTPSRGLRNDNTLAVLRPHLAVEWHQPLNGGLTPEMVTIGSNAQVYWECPSGHIYPAVVKQRALKGTRCPFCPSASSRRPSGDYNFLTECPQEAKDWHPTLNGDEKPYMFSPARKKQYYWLCPEGHPYKASMQSRKKSSGKNGGCPYCNHKKATPLYNLAVVNSDLSEQWALKANSGLRPYDVLPRSKKSVFWKCLKRRDHTQWPATIDKRNDNRGCPKCANFSIQMDEPGVFYLTTGKKWGKVGISNEKSFESRMAEHRRNGEYGGDNVLLVIPFEKTRDAKRFEDKVLRWIDESQEVRATPEGDERHNGYTEAFPVEMLENVMTQVTAWEMERNFFDDEEDSK
jgi:hypothetical protein